MSGRARCASALAEHLTHSTATPVTISWDNPSGRPGHGSWQVQWTDGPTTTTMRALAAGHARFVGPLDVATLRWSRRYTPRAWAAALLTRAANNTLPDTAAEAAALAEYDLHDTDATTWTTSTMHAAADLAHRNDSSPPRMATAVLTEHATRPCNETPPATTANATNIVTARPPGRGPAPPTPDAPSCAATGSSATDPSTSTTGPDDPAASAQPHAASPNTDDSARPPADHAGQATTRRTSPDQLESTQDMRTTP